jgi:SAM-dependent methyltransferase
VGGLWDEMGKKQLDYLVSQGLRPEHTLLDIGCGALRAGVHFIGYLGPGKYIGVEKEQKRLDAALRFELTPELRETKKPRLVHMENFDFASLGVKVDYALAQSVFSHLPLNVIIRCVLNADRVLAPEGKFYATFFQSTGPKFHLDPFVQRHGEPPTHFDQNPFHYSFEVFEWICEGSGLKPEYLGDWGHPRGQKMLVFKRR